MGMDFDSWFQIVQSEVGAAGYSFSCEDSVRDDYNNDRCPHVVAQEIVDEYST